MSLLLVLAVLTGLPLLSQTVRVLLGVLFRLIAVAFVMALIMVALIEFAAHGKPF